MLNLIAGDVPLTVAVSVSSASVVPDTVTGICTCAHIKLHVQRIGLIGDDLPRSQAPSCLKPFALGVRR